MTHRLPQCKHFVAIAWWAAWQWKFCRFQRRITEELQMKLLKMITHPGRDQKSQRCNLLQHFQILFTAHILTERNGFYIWHVEHTCYQNLMLLACNFLKQASSFDILFYLIQSFSHPRIWLRADHAFRAQIYDWMALNQIESPYTNLSMKLSLCR